jgi:hypothetical protein
MRGGFFAGFLRDFPHPPARKLFIKKKSARDPAKPILPLSS